MTGGLDEKRWFYKAVVQRWVDADTVDVVIAVGFYMETTQRLRLLGSVRGVDTPELRSQDPRERARALDAVRRVNGLLPAGSPCYLITDRSKSGDPRDSFGRFLSRVLLLDGTDVGDLLLAEGLAVPYVRA